jgi:hypothetical protein
MGASLFRPSLRARAAIRRSAPAGQRDLEEYLRRCERAGDFGPHFIALARSVYRQNDRRNALKREINERLGSQLIEEKSYSGL